MTEAKRLPWMKWYPRDWRGDGALRMCSLSARGLWADLISLIHDEGAPYGHLTIGGAVPTASQLARILGASAREIEGLIKELSDAGVFDRSVQGAIVCRRMVRDKQRADADRANGPKGGNPDLLRGTVPKEERSRPYKRTDSPQKTKRIFDACDGHCHWCSVPLRWGGDGEPGADLFHVDHLIAIRDGGTNDENNLVASCAACNHQRARQDIPTVRQCSCRKHSDHNPDTKAQKPEARDQKPEEESGFKIPLPDLRASRASPGPRGTTPEGRRELWRGKVTRYVTAHAPPDELEEFAREVAAGTPKGRELLDRWDRVMRQSAVA